MALRRFRAPGRVNLIGEHTDYSGGLALPAAIDLAVTVEAELGGDVIELSSDRHEGVARCRADGTGLESGSGWGRYVAAVAVELAALGRAPIGLRGRVSADLPDGAGLSSSAALEVVSALALCAAAGLELAPLDVAAVGQRAERRAVGTLGGILDQAASVLGRRGSAVLLDCASLEHRSVPLPPGVALVVIDTGLQRRLEESGFGERRRELEQALEALGGEEVARLPWDEVEGCCASHGLGDEARRRVRHVVTENARVLAVVEALERPGGADLAALGELFAAGHASLRDDYEVSTAELDLLVELALEQGAPAARMTGGGFGGAIVALAPRDEAEELAGRVVTAYDARLDGRLRATALVCEAAEGAGEV